MADDKELELIKETQVKILEAIDSLEYGRLENEQASWVHKFTDQVVGFIGSWKFLVMQSCVLAFWVWLNLHPWAWDPRPFILLNLILSFQASFTAPLILMAQNRADAKDRRRAQHAYRTIERIECLLVQLVERIQAFKNGNGQTKKEPGNKS